MHKLLMSMNQGLMVDVVISICMQGLWPLLAIVFAPSALSLWFCAQAFDDHDDRKFLALSHMASISLGGFGFGVRQWTAPQGTCMGLAWPYMPLYGINHDWDPVTTKLLIKIRTRSQV